MVSLCLLMSMLSKNVKIPDAEKLEMVDLQNYGFYSNISFSSDVKKSYWADLAADSRYKSNHLAAMKVPHVMQKAFTALRLTVS